MQISWNSNQLEVDLKMFNDRSDFPSIGRLLSIIHRKTQIYLQRELEPYGLGHGQVRILRYLDRHPGVRQQDISEHFKLDKGSTSNLITSLVKKGFIRKERAMEDHRAYNLIVTEKTIELRPKLKEIFNKWSDNLMHGFSEEEQELFIVKMERMIINAEEEIKKCHRNGEEKL